MYVSDLCVTRREDVESERQRAQAAKAELAATHARITAIEGQLEELGVAKQTEKANLQKVRALVCVSHVFVL